MRKLFALLTLLLLLTMAVASYGQGGLDATIIADARLRSGPGTDWRIISVVPAGTAIRLDGRAGGGGWVRGVTQNNEQGWIVDTAINLSADQVASLPPKGADEPYSLGAPGGAAPAQAP